MFFFIILLVPYLDYEGSSVYDQIMKNPCLCSVSSAVDICTIR